ncbi:MAG TPA: LEA type 2 family protein [Phycisphaerales bacterium]|nr:LEA type 2 family protein [Phycisphaerales bacterium]
MSSTPSQATGRLLRIACSIGLAAGGFCAVGCESYSAPVLSVAKAAPTERTQDGAAMLFTLDARNDNDDPLPLREVEYRVDLNGREVFHGSRSAEATLRRLGIQQLSLPAAVPITPDTAGVVNGPVRYRLSGSMYYITPGRLAETLFDAGVRKPSVSFDFEGEIDLSAAKFTSTRSVTGTDGSESPVERSTAGEAGSR